MLKIVFIRHGKTQGNLEKRYIGTTDEDLLNSERDVLKNKTYPDCHILYSSPLKRCIQTANIIYPSLQPVICEKLKETDFGDFENKNYIELSDNPLYQKWVDSGGKDPFPGGESREQFQKRCIEGFNDILNDVLKKISEGKLPRECTVSIVIHGGSIMALMSEFALEKKDFYFWQVKNGQGFVCCLTEEKRLNVLEKIQ